MACQHTDLTVDCTELVSYTATMDVTQPGPTTVVIVADTGNYYDSRIDRITCDACGAEISPAKEEWQ